jgi:glycosyltransferase involved in cell wall biosynthesis
MALCLGLWQKSLQPACAHDVGQGMDQGQAGMDMGHLGISIIIPTRNRAGLLSQTLDSVQQQTWSDGEVIVVDDGSQDGAERLMPQRCQDDGGFAMRVVHPQAPIGTWGNWGTQLALGQYVLF